jgi:hypothetical protein
MKLLTILTALFTTAVLAHPAPAKDNDASTEIFGGPPGGSETIQGVRLLRYESPREYQLT